MKSLYSQLKIKVYLHEYANQEPLTISMILIADYAQREREREAERKREREREREREETVDHIVSACPTIVNTEYPLRHDLVLVSYTRYYVNTSICPAQKNGINIHHNQ